MNRKILFLALIMTIGTFTYIQTKFHKPTTQQSNLLTANIEAIANGEKSERLVCYNTITSKEGCKVRYCQICEYVDGTDAWYAFSDDCLPK